LLAADPKVVCPGAQHAETLRKLLLTDPPDLVLTVWSEWATAMAHTLPIPVFAYYGNPDPKAARARLYTSLIIDKSWRKPRLWAGFGKSLARYAVLGRAHKKVVRGLSGLSNVAFNDAEYYRRVGLKSARYIRNMWADDTVSDWAARRDQLEQEKPVKIIGSVGNLRSTGNTIGLHVLLRDVLPELRGFLGEGGFELHLFGGGDPHPNIKKYLGDPHVKLRGFVPDLDTEILSAPVFVVATNSNPVFKVGNTRYLHAWSLGSCCVGFDGIRDAMPEIIHEHNALLAKTPRELAKQIARACRDRPLRRRLGETGMKDTETLFNPQTVVETLERAIVEILRPRVTRS
jgi:glycosyltransferase involved in cell wall biosynthesis